MGRLENAVFIDSNILVFANVEKYPEHERALKVLEDGLKGEFVLSFNTVIALEAHYKLLKILNASDARYRVGTLFKSKRTLFFNVDEEAIEKAFEISEKYKIGTNDAAIAASMLGNGIEKIYTDNKYRSLQKD
ncbi:MAG: type II toxin-antitoxin system VapC family toxin [Candidatus Hydrothermarchaeales archaeon]